MKRAPLFLAVAMLPSSASDSWLGTIYPNKYDLKDYIHIGKFDSLEECRVAAQSLLYEMGKIEEGDYECGLN